MKAEDFLTCEMASVAMGLRAKIFPEMVNETSEEVENSVLIRGEKDEETGKWDGKAIIIKADSFEYAQFNQGVKHGRCFRINF